MPNYNAKPFKPRHAQFGTTSANLNTRGRIPNADVAYPTPGFAGVKPMRGGDKAVESFAFAEGSRPFLVRGKSQKALSQQDTPLTVEQVRELLNKNK